MTLNKKGNKDMIMRKSFLNLGLGVVGGCIAFVGIDALRGERENTASRLEILSPAAARPVSLSSTGGMPIGGAGSIDLREAAKKTVPAVVHVKTVQMGREYMNNPLLDFFYGNSPRTQEAPQRMGFGSGVIVSEDGYIITNNHVIENSDKITVVLNNKKEYEAKVVGTDPNTDIALLKVEENGLPYIEYANSDDVELGEWVLAVGNPYNLTSTVTAGIISAKARELGINRSRMNLESFLQTDAAVNPGNSGGALVNAQGELIGINTAIESPTGSYSGYSFAVPANIARKVVGDLKEFGTVQRAVIGISMRELTPDVAKQLGVDELGGIYVFETIPGGAAAKSGIKKGDIIKYINGIEVSTVPAFQGQLGKYHPGTSVKVTVKRDGKLKDVDVILQNNYGDTSLVDKQFTGILGVTVEPLSREDQMRYRLNKGVKITKVENGPFKAIGLEKGYIIVKMNDMVIYDKDDLVKALKMAENEGVLVTTVSPRGRVEYYALSLQN